MPQANTPYILIYSIYEGYGAPLCICPWRGQHQRETERADDLATHVIRACSTRFMF